MRDGLKFFVRTVTRGLVTILILAAALYFMGRF